MGRGKPILRQQEMQQVKSMRIAREYLGSASAELPAWIGWIPLGVSVVGATLTREAVEPWLFMWLMAFALWAGCKWLVLWREVDRGGYADFRKILAFLFLWPGMNARTFLRETGKAAPVKDWLAPLAKLFFGILLICLVAPHVSNDLLKGWTVMVALILVLHFGLFHLLAFAWQTRGINAEPLMRKPATATSLADFWGRRWNTAFHQLVYELIFKPAARLVGSRWALMTTFLLSGLTHELVISVPARGGYGLPTAYFVVQGAGVLFESSPLGKKLNLRRGFCGWLFTALVTAAPVVILFPPPFIRNVILPMFQTLNH
ncbi:MAG: rane protein [Verrucomicrobiales bacterium]|nr:rane protein [Verrucomicrobiales bacterium]